MTIGIVSALDLTNMKVPDGFEKHSSNSFEKGDYELNFGPYADSENELTFENDEDYTISKYSSNVYRYYDKLLENVGAIEVVEIDGHKYLVECLKRDAPSSDSSVCDYLTEFNRLNNLTPIEP